MGTFRVCPSAFTTSISSKSHRINILFYSDPEIEKLDIQGNALSEAWAHFKGKLPPEEQIEFAKRPQEFADVINVVRKVEEHWQQKKKKGVSGHAKRYFRRVCTKLDSHSTLLEILPSGSQYASVFCGTLQTLIKVSPIRFVLKGLRYA